MMLAIGCDHGGFSLKAAVKNHLERLGHKVEDFGCYSEDSVDYALVAEKVGQAVAEKKADFGFLVCSTGIGISIAANKVKGVRAALCSDSFSAEMTRRHNNANVLCMGGKIVDEKKALELVDIFLATEFEGGRHQRRIDQISEIENNC